MKAETMRKLLPLVLILSCMMIVAAALLLAPDRQARAASVGVSMARVSEMPEHHGLYRYQDPSGNVCYVTVYGTSVAISCVK